MILWAELTTDQKRAAVRPLWDEGLPASVIAQRLGCSKNAVIGVAHRCRMPQRQSPLRVPRTPEQKREYDRLRQAARQARKHTLPPLQSTKEPPPMVIADARQIVLAAPVVAPEPPPPVILAFPTLALPPPTFARCQWPTNDGEGMRWTFCGSRDVEAGRPYCLSHCLIAYNGYRRRECVALPHYEASHG